MNNEDLQSLINDLESKLTFKEGLPIGIQTIEPNLGFVGVGISRAVYKFKNKRYVLKLERAGYNNLAEYAFYQGLNGNKFQSLFAACPLISAKGKILVMENVPKAVGQFIPQTQEDYTYFKDLEELLQEALAQPLRSITKDTYPILDIHGDNLRVSNSGIIKITDYSTYVSTLVEFKKVDIQTCISRIKRYTKPLDQPCEFYLTQDKRAVLKIGSDTAITPKLKYKIDHNGKSIGIGA